MVLGVFGGKRDVCGILLHPPLTAGPNAVIFVPYVMTDLVRGLHWTASPSVPVQEANSQPNAAST